MNDFQGGFQGGYQGGYQGGNQAGFGGGGQLAPQGFLGGMLGAPLGGLIGKGVGGLFGRPDLGSQIGNIAGGIGGALLPFGADPMQAAYQQQALQQQLLQQLQQQQPQQGELSPQGWFGNLVGSVGRPLGGMIGGALGNQQLGSTIGGVAGQLGRMLPFGADPLSMQQFAQMPPQALIQQIQQLQQQLQQQQQQYAQLVQQVQQMQQQAQGGQQGQMTPQGWFGNLIGAVGQPLGSAIGGALGNQQLGSTIGGAAGQLGRMLPFGADPLSQAWLQQAQLAQQQAQLGQGYNPAQNMYAQQPTLH